LTVKWKSAGNVDTRAWEPRF